MPSVCMNSYGSLLVGVILFISHSEEKINSVTNFTMQKKIDSTESTNLGCSFSHTDKYLSFKCLRQMSLPKIK